MEQSQDFMSRPAQHWCRFWFGRAVQVYVLKYFQNTFSGIVWNKFEDKCLIKTSSPFMLKLLLTSTLKCSYNSTDNVTEGWYLDIKPSQFIDCGRHSPIGLWLGQFNGNMAHKNGAVKVQGSWEVIRLTAKKTSPKNQCIQHWESLTRSIGHFWAKLYGMVVLAVTC